MPAGGRRSLLESQIPTLSARLGPMGAERESSGSKPLGRGERPAYKCRRAHPERHMPDSLTTNSPIIAAYRAATPGSATRAATAGELFPSGITHDSRYIEPYGIYIDPAKGPRKWDVDGRCYVDYFGGDGARRLGPFRPRVRWA